MRGLRRAGLSGAIAAAVVLGAYLVLSPAVWSRELLDLLPMGAAISAGGSVAMELSLARSKAQPRLSWARWLVGEISEALAVGAGFVLASLLFSGQDPRGLVVTDAQQSVVVLCLVAIAAFVLSTSHGWRRHRTRADEAREARLAAARAQARSDVDAFVAGLRRPEGGSAP